MQSAEARGRAYKAGLKTGGEGVNGLMIAFGPLLVIVSLCLFGLARVTKQSLLLTASSPSGRSAPIPPCAAAALVGLTGLVVTVCCLIFI
jgi:hypothetical protein